MKRVSSGKFLTSVLAFGLLTLIGVTLSASNAEPGQVLTSHHDLTGKLEGRSYEWTYTSGHRYWVIFEDGLAKFKLLAGSENAGPGASYPYIARLVRPGMFLIQWWAADVKIYVTLLIDEESRQVYASWNSVSGLEFETADEGLIFDVGDIHTINGEK